MNRRGFLTSLAATALTGGCRSFLSGPSRADELMDELKRTVQRGDFDSAILGTNLGPIAAIGAAERDSRVEIASVSKVFVHHLAAILWTQGRLDLDAPFTTYLPDHVLARAGTAITCRDLAAHASGFTNAWMGRAGVYSKTWPYRDDAAWERAVLAVRPEFPRRTKYVYACHNTILLGFIVERLLGEDLDAAARRLVWNPLGMTSTTWRNCVGDPRVWQTYTNGACPKGLKGDPNARAVGRPIGNAGVFTTFDDLARYADDLLARRAFADEVYGLLFRPEFAWERKRRSFGWDMSEGTNPPGWSSATINHAGYTGQYLAVDPAAGRAAIVLTNLRLTDAAGRLRAFEDRRRWAAWMG